MRSELYSVRSSERDVEILNRSLKRIITELNSRTGIKILFKTEIDYNPKKIRTELIESFEADNPPEFYIYANALESKDNSSFCYLFEPFMEMLEGALPEGGVDEQGQKLYPHIKVYPINDLPGGYPAYCFTFRNKKILALPRITLLERDLCNYLCKAVDKAKVIFAEAFTQCPDGFVYAPKKPRTFFERLFGRKPLPSAHTADQSHKTASTETSDSTQTDTSAEITDTAAVADTPTESPATAPKADTDKGASGDTSAAPATPATPANAPVAASDIFDGIIADTQTTSPGTEDLSDTPATAQPADEEITEAPLAPKKKSGSNLPASEFFDEIILTDSADTADTTDTSDTIDTDSEACDSVVIPCAEDVTPTAEAPLNSTEGAPAEDSEDTSLSSEEDSSADNKDTKKKKNFLHTFIPMKGDSPKAIILKILVLVAIIGFLAGAYMLLDFFVLSPWQNTSEMTDIQDIFYGTEDEVIVTDPEGNIISATPDETKPRNWKGLKKVNDEIVGWVKMDGTKIDYPVLHHKGDNAESQFYLYLNYKKTYSEFGSIFVDYRCEESLDSKHVILHGHNMGSDDSMFGSIIRYARANGWTKGNPKYYKQHPTLELDTPKADGDWIIFAVMKIDVANNQKDVFNYLRTDFSSDAQYMNFIYNVKVRSYLDIEVPINENDRLLTLSTCSYETDHMRTIAVARQIREGEDISKYVSTVKEQLPAKKAYSTFGYEYSAGNITWYDGEGNLEGNESLDYMAPAKTYTVTFMDGNGNVLSKQKVVEGDDAVPPLGGNPQKAPDDKYYYTFRKWDTSYKKVKKNLVITPIFDKHKKPVVTNPEVEETDPPVIIDPVTPTEAPPAPTQAPTPTTAPPLPPETQAPTPIPTEPAPTTPETPVATDAAEAVVSTE